MRPKLVALLAAALLAGLPVGSRAAEPITIGFAEALTGGLAVVGKSGVLAQQIWADEVNAKGGLLGRPVKLVFYDNQSNAANVPGIYTKLLDVDHVDLIVSGYATNMVAPAMPVAMAHNKVFVSLFCLAVNSEFHYPRYFSMLPTGPGSEARLLAAATSTSRWRRTRSRRPSPSSQPMRSSRATHPTARATTPRRPGSRSSMTAPIRRPPPTTRRSCARCAPPIRTSIYVASYPPDTAGILRAANEIGLKTQLFGGSMVGVQTTALKTQLGPLLNGIVVNENWLPAPTMQFPGVLEFLKRYQAKAPARGRRSAGLFPAALGVCADADHGGRRSKGTQSLDDEKLADYFKGHTFKTIIGDVTFGKDGEWVAPRIVWTQFQNIKGNDVEQFKDPAAEVVVLPAELKSGYADLAVQCGEIAWAAQ